MENDLLKQKLTELNTFSRSDLPLLITDYYSTCDRSNNLSELYLDFCKQLSSADCPSPDQFIYIFNMFDTDATSFNLKKSIKHNEKLLRSAIKSEDDTLIRLYTGRIHSFNSEIRQCRTLLLKHSDSALNREGRLTESKESGQITVQQLNVLLQKSDDVLSSAEEKEVNPLKDLKNVTNKDKSNNTDKGD